MIRGGFAATALMTVLVSGCGTTGTHARWEPREASTPTFSPEPVPEPAAAHEPVRAPEIRPKATPGSELHTDFAAQTNAAPHPGQAYTEAESALRLHLVHVALRAADAVVAAHRAEDTNHGPELVWFPTLRQVAARQRLVTYAVPQAGNVLRSSDVHQPFLIEVVVRCVVHTTSGDGIAYVGDAPSTAIPDDRILPHGTRATDLAAIAAGLRPAATAALAALADIPPMAETVHVTLLFAYRRAHDDVVLLRHAKVDPQP